MSIVACIQVNLAPVFRVPRVRSSFQVERRPTVPDYEFNNNRADRGLEMWSQQSLGEQKLWALRTLPCKQHVH
eukprot:1283109-Pyramimonas_sp.AAC.3